MSWEKNMNTCFILIEICFQGHMHRCFLTFKRQVHNSKKNEGNRLRIMIYMDENNEKYGSCVIFFQSNDSLKFFGRIF